MEIVYSLVLVNIKPKLSNWKGGNQRTPSSKLGKENISLNREKLKLKICEVWGSYPFFCSTKISEKNTLCYLKEHMLDFSSIIS